LVTSFLGQAFAYVTERLVALAALLPWAWGIFAISYATSPPTEGLLGVSVIIGVTFTCFAERGETSCTQDVGQG
jgi:hypothetical protein